MSMNNSSGSSLPAESSSVDAMALERKCPLENQIDMGGHTKAVTCVSSEPAGNRLVTGSLDYSIKIYDFGGMDSRLKAFRSIEVEDGYPIVSIAHSSTGDRFIVGTASCQPKVYDRDGKEIIKFVRGDMYIRDMTHTKGHVMEVTGVAWHPTEKNVVLSSSLDGTVRVWDLLGEAAFGNLTSRHVLKLKGKTAARVGATCCCFSPDGTRLAGGGADGSVQIWNVKKVYSSRPDLLMKSPPSATGLRGHADGTIVTSVAFDRSGTHIASRGSDGLIVLWSLKPLAQGGGNHQLVPVKVFDNTRNVYPQANVEFSPDGKMLCCGTSVGALKTARKDNSNSSSDPVSNSSQSGDGKCFLLFFDVAGKNVDPVLRISVINVGSVIFVKWQPNTNQIFCSTANGFTRVFYDPRMSKKGVLLAATRAPKREKDPTDYAVVGEIINPHALPMFRTDNSLKKRAIERRAEAKSHVPEQQVSTGPKKAANNSFFFTQYVMHNKQKDQLRSQDPREALLKYDKLTTSDPMYLGPAYKDSQPATVLHSETFEEEEESFRKKQKQSL